MQQRWTSLKKKQGNSKVGTSSQSSETLAAAHRAAFIALDMHNSKGASHIAGIKPEHQSEKASESPAAQQLGRAGPFKPQLPRNLPSVHPTSTPDPKVTAAAVAAGARIASAADATSLIARSPNVVHITTGVSSVMKSCTTSIANQLPSNVHFIRNGLAKAPISTYSAPKPNTSEPGEVKHAQNWSIKPAASAVPTPVGTVPVLNVTSVKQNATASISSTEIPKTTEDTVASTSANEIKELRQSNQGADPADSSGRAPMERLSEDQSAALGDQSEIEKHRTSSLGNALEQNTQGDQASISTSGLSSQTTDDGVALPGSEVEDKGKTSTDNQFASEEILENPSSEGRQEDLPSPSKDGNAI